MIIVVDANSFIAALLKEGKARKIIVGGEFTLVSPDYLRAELEKHKDYIAKKAGISRGELELLVTLLLRRVRIVSYLEYRGKIREAKEIMKEDLNDVPYVACYLALKCDGIWTNDPDYKGKQLKLISTGYLLRLL